jgi:hypothetical protein
MPGGGYLVRKSTKTEHRDCSQKELGRSFRALIHSRRQPALVMVELMQSVPARAHSAAEKCAWFTSAAAALICLVAGTAAQGQIGRNVADDRAVVIESICRQYAAALSDMPTDLMFKQCMYERNCRPVPSPPGYWCEPPQPMQVKPG